MSEYRATIDWQRQGQDFLDHRYSRGHEWIFDGGVVVPASSSPHIVPVPMSVAANVDPEEAFVASLSSCHMLFFLDFASRGGWVVERYTDQVVGTLAKNADGLLAITEVVLRPAVIFSGSVPGTKQLVALHHRSHEACFIARSVTAEVRCEPIIR
ncbi:MAG: OsmC family protein [Marinobacterium sp.]|nr:OsmC family protein [Marinobacterium sp.]